MVCLRSSSLVLGLFLSLATLGDSISTTNQAIETLVYTSHAVSANRIVQELRVELEARKWRKMRKMMIKEVMKQEMKGKIERGGGQAQNINVRKCENGDKGDLNLECEMRVSRSPPSSVELVGLIPFISDYHAPKTHPPKNN